MNAAVPSRALLIAAAMLVLGSPAAKAQLPPVMGYMYPPGGQAGQTLEVTLGGYDWTPDMEVVMHDPRIKLEITGSPGPVIVPEPPFWFGAKARRGPFLLPRHFPARLTIPAEVPPGIYRYQVANANGASASGKFVVSDLSGTVEVDDRQSPQPLSSLPAAVSGRIKLIEEVDRYEFTAEKTGPVTCDVLAESIGSDLSAILEIRDSQGQMIADAADTAGSDTHLTFAAQAGQRYTVSIYDVDFRGDRSLTYRLQVAAAPRVVAAVPAVGQRGATQAMQFVGYGVATGKAQLETVTREVSFPTDPKQITLAYRLETPFGVAAAFEIPLSDSPQLPSSSIEGQAPVPLTAAVEATGVLRERHAEAVYHLSGKKGEMWNFEVQSARLGSNLDMALAIRNAEGAEVARADDLTDSIDAVLDFTVPADGNYTLSVVDLSGNSGAPAAVYHLRMAPGRPSFTLIAPEMLSAPLGGSGRIALKATRSPGFKDPIAITLDGLPPGVSVPEGLVIPVGKVALNIDLTVAADAKAAAGFVTIQGEVKQEDQTISSASSRLLLATTIVPPFSLDAEGKDDVTKWPRGTTFPGPVLIERNEGFTADIVLEMSARQGRHRMGITGPEITVPNGVTRVIYPVYLPEWLETTRTSRMIVNGLAKVADPQGNIRYSLNKQKSRMGFLPTGALLKLAADFPEMTVSPGQTWRAPLSISRSDKLKESLHLELVRTEGVELPVTGPAMDLDARQTQAEFPLIIDAQAQPGAEYPVTIRATAVQPGNLPVISETTVLLIVPNAQASK